MVHAAQYAAGADAPYASLGSPQDDSSFIAYAALACLVWYVAVQIVSAIGHIQLKRQFSRPPPPAACLSLSTSSLPHITVVRPVSGLEPCLRACLASTFQQDYPAHKLTTHLCVSSRGDPSLPILESLLRDDFPGADARIFVEDEDPHVAALGPNPKIRNMSRAYREARGEAVWVIDCNVWVERGAAGHMVDALYGHGPGRRKNKFVHQLPLVVDLGKVPEALDGDPAVAWNDMSSTPQETLGGRRGPSLLPTGSRLEEMFMASAHAKFYTAINTVLIAPCIVGKSNMFRRAHLDALTGGKGIDFFSHNICEDHLIGDLLWKRPVPASLLEDAATADDDVGQARWKWGNHALVPSAPCLQPFLPSLPISTFASRRTRWLRVRKYTVPLATLVEPGTESFVASAALAFALTVSLSPPPSSFTTDPAAGAFERAAFHPAHPLLAIRAALHVPPTWPAFVLIWLLSQTAWLLADRRLYVRLHSHGCFAPPAPTSKDTSATPPAPPPPFARPSSPHLLLPPLPWTLAWLTREALALPVWAWAIWGGATVVWRGRGYYVGFDGGVHVARGGRGWVGGFVERAWRSVGGVSFTERRKRE